MARKRPVSTTERPGKVTRELHEFVAANRVPIAELQRLMEQQFGLVIQQNTIYKIWNGWIPLKLRATV